ncbi:MAG: ABC transporter ATP-binding protein [Candidatus Thorarchaeota archaeon]
MANDNRQKRTPTRYMLAGLYKQPAVVTFALILTVISALLTTIPSVFLGLAVKELDDTNAITAVFMNLIWTIVILTLVYMVMYFVVGYVWAVVTLRWERDARQEFFEILQENSMSFHDEVDSKKLLSVAMQDISWIRLSLNPALRNIAGGLASFAITAAFLIVIDFQPGMGSIPVFTLIMVIGSPLYLAFAYRYASAVEPVRRKRSETMEKLTSISQGVFSGIEVVRAFGAEEREKSKFVSTATDYERIVAKEGRLAAFYVPALVLIAMTTLAFFYGGLLVLDPAITAFSRGTLVQVLALLSALIFLNFQFPWMLLMLRGGWVNAKRVVDILNWDDPMVEPDEPIEVDWNRDIVFDNVSFSYNANNGENPHYAIQNLSLTIPGGSRVALIGGPGGGKSTILKLLLRFYDPNEGSIMIGDVDLRNVSTDAVRDAVGLVEQDIFLFRMSVKDNIAFGRPDASAEEITEAARRAQADEFIVEMPEGYDSMIGERGMTLSGGQRQRLAIARALIQDPKLLLLDDSVSAVDAQTEYLMRKALDAALVNRTSVTVTQRLRTLIESDLVVIVDKGRLIASGCHEDLLRTSEHYRRIFERLPGASALLGTIPLRGGAT